MNRFVGWIIGGALLLGSVFILSTPTVFACHSDGDMGRTIYTTTTVRVDPGGVTHYEFGAVCYTSAQASGSGMPFSASGTWDPGKKQARERLSGEGGWHGRWKNVETTWACPTDPRLTRLVYCDLLGLTGNRESEGFSLPDERPFSAGHAEIEQLRERAKQAIPAAPAMPPRDVKASVHFPVKRAHITWGIPVDQTSMHRTIAWFEVLRRPAGEPSVAWFAASGKLPANATSHHDRDPHQSKTEYLVCAGNVGGKICSQAVPTLGYIEKGMLDARTAPRLEAKPQGG